MRRFALLTVFFFLLSLSLSANSTVSQDYESWSAREKQDYLWKQVEKSQYAENQLPSSLSLFSMVKLLSSKYLIATFKHSSDELPMGRKKLIHSFGTVAKISFLSIPSSYTGVLKSGAIGVVRFSLAGAGASYTPGFGLKFLVDGHPSLNIMAMYSLDGQGEDRNYFSNPFTTTIGEPSSPFLKLPLRAFSKAVKLFNSDASPFVLPVGHMAAMQSNGSVELAPVIPRHLKFVPVFGGFDSGDKTDLRVQLGRLRPGTVLYKVYAQSLKDEELEYLGDLVLTSSFVASCFGDEGLFFRHHPALGQEWK
ncbi:MAG: hypothetical protein A2X86_08505 [Bdellovibrionales bacterium GWA2_49_15]|nr:MAG: hypothetical protein A2X86_08505 [Bdellovibrionales bacterium GWA2_49_15]HAZ11197.1 hypothetical protein [Bdellovibrionales bacterium]